MGSGHLRLVTRRRRVASAVALVAAAVAGCSGTGGDAGGADDPGEGAALLDQVAEATLSSSSLEGSLQVFYRVHERGHSRTIEGHVDADGVGTLAVSFEPDPIPLTLELRSDGERAWVDGRDDPALEDVLPGGTRWVAAPIDDLRALGVLPLMTDLLAAVPLVRGLEPDTDERTSAAGDIDRVLVGELDWDAALDAATADEVAALRPVVPVGDTGADRHDGADPAGGLHAVAPVDGAAVASARATVTIDRDGRVRTLTVSIAADSPEGPLSIELNFMATSYDQEVPSPPEPPGAVALDDVPRFRDLLESEV